MPEDRSQTRNAELIPILRRLADVALDLFQATEVPRPDNVKFTFTRHEETGILLAVTLHPYFGQRQ